MTDKIFPYVKGSMRVEDVDVNDIVEAVGTPFYCYSARRLRDNYHAFAKAMEGLDATVCYAVKANMNRAVIKTLADCGAGADVTSVGELERALGGGVPANRIVYSGVGKRREEIAAALEAGIDKLNAESLPELYSISQVAAELGITAGICLRVNPDVDAKTHKKTSTGHKESKFGIDMEQLDEAIKLASTLPWLQFRGLMVHVGSHVYDYEPFRLAYSKLADMVRDLRGKGFKIDRLDLGGGVGIAYDGQQIAPFADYAAIVRETVGGLGCALVFEPGRRLVGDAGILVSRVVYCKKTPSKNFLIIDAGMNDLIRPAMYEARHSIRSVRQATGELASYDVVGPVCETGDMFGENFHLPTMQSGDLIAIMQAGAYGSAMASAYNGRPLPPEILVDGASFKVVRRRVTVAEQITWETQ